MDALWAKLTSSLLSQILLLVIYLPLQHIQNTHISSCSVDLPSLQQRNCNLLLAGS